MRQYWIQQLRTLSSHRVLHHGVERPTMVELRDFSRLEKGYNAFCSPTRYGEIWIPNVYTTNIQYVFVLMNDPLKWHVRCKLSSSTTHEYISFRIPLNLKYNFLCENDAVIEDVCISQYQVLMVLTCGHVCAVRIQNIQGANEMSTVVLEVIWHSSYCLFAVVY